MAPLNADIAYLFICLVLAALLAFSWWFRRRKIALAAEDLRKELHALRTRGAGKRPPELSGDGAAVLGIAQELNGLLANERQRLAPDAGNNPLFTTLAAALPEVTLIHSKSILFANRAAGALIGVKPESLVGKAISDLVRPAYRGILRKHVSHILKGTSPPAPLEVQLIDGDGGVWVELHSRRVMWRGEPALLSVARDIGHRKSVEATLGRSKLLGRITLESIGEGIITTDPAGIIDYMNESAEQFIGTNRSMAVGKRLIDLVALIDESDRQPLADPVLKSLRERRRVNLGRHALLVSKQAEREFSTELTASPIRGPDGHVAGCVVIFHDVSELRGLAREMSYQATHDALTGLVNRLEFERRLEAAVKAARGETVGHVVGYLDLDRFKVVNDSCGHIAGDNLLRELAALLKEKLRDSDTVARLGGDEFAMLLTGCPLDKARQIADDVCRSIAEYPFTWQDQRFDIGASIGLVEVGRESASAEAVLSAADSACYVAKQRGRGRVHVYSARDEVRARERGEIHWLQRLQRALKENQFELHVQAIIAVGNRVPNGPAVEVLLRMREESGKTVLPAEFLGAAARYQLMPHVDRWVVQATLAAIAGGALRLPDHRTCSINLSAQTLADDDFLEYIVEALDYTGVEPGKLCFEIPESAVTGNIEHAQRFIAVLHGVGCRFALDNFGSGIGSFANLKHLALDYLKIDGLYTRNLAVDGINREMVSAMIKLSRTLDFGVVAEQIEDQMSFEAARQLGVDFVQGFVVERPQPLRQLH